jgi:hypothetical protein
MENNSDSMINWKALFLGTLVSGFLFLGVRVFALSAVLYGAYHSIFELSAESLTIKKVFMDLSKNWPYTAILLLLFYFFLSMRTQNKILNYSNQNRIGIVTIMDYLGVVCRTNATQLVKNEGVVAAFKANTLRRLLRVPDDAMTAEACRGAQKVSLLDDLDQKLK